MENNIVEIEYVSRESYYSKQPHELSKNPNISLNAKGLYGIYSSFTNRNKPFAWPSEKYLCHLCGNIYPKTFRKYKKELIRNGWISQEQTKKENGKYSTLKIKVYETTSLNPRFQDIKTDDAFLAVPKSTGQEVDILTNKNNDTSSFYFVRKKKYDHLSKNQKDEQNNPNNSCIKKQEESLITKKDLIVTKNLSSKIKKHLLINKIKKLNLVKKPKVVTYFDYGLKPGNFYKDDLGSFLDKCLSFVIKNNIAPEKEVTEKLVRYWNDIDNNLFSHHRTTNNFRNTDTFKKFCLIVSYKMNKYNLSYDKITDAIDLLNDLSKYNRHLKYKKKIHFMTTFLWNSKIYSDIDWFECCIKSRHEAFKASKTAQPKFEKTMERTKRYFINTYFDEKDKSVGEDLFNAQFYKFKQFSDQMVLDHQTKEMCGWTINDLIREYFEYTQRMTGNLDIEYKHSANYILSASMKSNFIMRMKNEPGFEAFWRLQKKTS